jgi:organic radical activating enzyme
MQSGSIEEIFASIQGEGPWIGQRHIFIRFRGCDISCRYCDTPAARKGDREQPCRVQRGPDSFATETIPCPVTPEQLSQFCSRLFIPGPGKPVLSLTGGEPLLHESFLSVWLPLMKKRSVIYLETNGINHQAMSDLRQMVDVVSMDVKLPSATGLRPFWNEHEKFLSAARGTALLVKAVVTAETCLDDVLTAARLVSVQGPEIPFILQPAGGRQAPHPDILIRFQNAALGIVRDVRVIPQAHKILNVP